MFTKSQAAAYLAAMIDGEGWIGEPKGKQNRAIRIANTDADLIAAIKEACDCLGITHTVQHIRPRRENWSAGWVVNITGRSNMLVIARKVPLRCHRKKDRLIRTLATYIVPLAEKRLRQLYAAGYTQKEVAQFLGVSLKRVINAMNRYGILRRRYGPELSATIWRTRRKHSH